MSEVVSERLTHRDLCDVAVQWLRRPFSAKGHGCNFAVSECQSAFGGGETPDAIGFRAMGRYDGSVVVEAKVSRGDFLADRSKPHRMEGGMGNWRYFIAPKGLLIIRDLPPRWGLLEVNDRRQIVSVMGAAAGLAGAQAAQHLEGWRHDNDANAEMSLMVRLMARVGDPEKLNRRIAETNARYSALFRRHERQMEVEKRMQGELLAYRLQDLAQRTPAPATREERDHG